MIETIKEQLRESTLHFFEEKGIAALPVSFDRTDSFAHGHLFTNSAFAAAKELRVAPFAIAEELAVFLSNAHIDGVEKVEAMKPGYVNVTLSSAFFVDLIAEINGAGEAYGTNDSLAGSVWALEHTSPNPNKAMHLGHLRNSLVGMSLGRVLEANGAQVIYEAVDNNRGIAIAKLMWGFLAHMKKEEGVPTDISYWQTHKDAWHTPQSRDMLPDLFVSECYVLGDQDCKDPATEGIVRGFVVSWEAGDEAVWELWSHVLAYSYAGMDRTLARLGSRWDYVWHEHEHYQKGKDYVEKGLVQGIFKKLEDGAVLTDLASFNLPDTILLKRDGTSLYITQDLALTALKKAKHHPDRMLWVVGPDQTLALRQLFAVCEQLGIAEQKDLTHVSYGYVGLKDEDGGFKKMSSRAGTVVLIDDVLDTVRDALIARMEGEGREGDLLLRAEKAEILARAAVKFSFLKPDRTQDLNFDVENSIETKGDSGIYVMYAYVRTQSILRKAQALGRPVGGIVASDDVGQEVAQLLLFFPHVVVHAMDDLSVHHVAQYLLEVCSAFNHWYSTETILDDGLDEAYKLAIVAAVGTVLKNGLTLMGITTIEEM